MTRIGPHEAGMGINYCWVWGWYPSFRDRLEFASLPTSACKPFLFTVLYLTNDWLSAGRVAWHHLDPTNLYKLFNAKNFHWKPFPFLVMETFETVFYFFNAVNKPWIFFSLWSISNRIEGVISDVKLQRKFIDVQCRLM